ncbi:MAG: corrinoid protein [Gracilibacteraceae bacterium]|jgi:corrinoid protein of di/trimethylamine methyltransferase|nr:corrinoid protein [Gracilibacteraceae bacterium]
MKGDMKMSKEAIFKQLSHAVFDGDDDLVVEAAEAAIKEGIDATEAIIEGLAAGMTKVGEYYEKQKYFLPEVIISAETFKQGIKILEPHLSKDIASPGTVLMGTVISDVHDIGKNIVIIMLSASGFKVIDLGKDVPPEAFVNKIKEVGKVDIVAMSALMTTSMMGMQDVVEALKKEGLRDKVKIMVGGAPVSQRFTDDIGADGYAGDAVEGVRVAKRLVGVQ